MGAHDYWTRHKGKRVGQDMLHRVAVDGGDADRSIPLMMCLVDVPVDPPVVKQPVVNG